MAGPFVWDFSLGVSVHGCNVFGWLVESSQVRAGFLLNKLGTIMFALIRSIQMKKYEKRIT